MWYLQCDVSQDDKTNTWCVQGVDAHGKLFGVGAGSTREDAFEALRLYILESLFADALNGIDPTKELRTSPPESPYSAVFSLYDLFPAYLRFLRVHKNLRQADVAKRLGITQQAYQKLERIGANPTLETIVKLGQALNIDFNLVAM